MRGFLLMLFGAASGWDGFTTVYGTWGIIGEGASAEKWAGPLVAVFFAIVILAFLIGTAFVWRDAQSVVSSVMMRVLWAIALLYDLFTSYLGNKDFVFGGNLVDWRQIALLVGMTLLVSASPIVVSLILQEKGKST